MDGWSKESKNAVSYCGSYPFFSKLPTSPRLLVHFSSFLIPSLLFDFHQDIFFKTAELKIQLLRRRRRKTK
jgi:hypothetical protein